MADDDIFERIDAPSDEEYLWQPAGSAARGRSGSGRAELLPAEIVENYKQ